MKRLPNTYRIFLLTLLLPVSAAISAQNLLSGPQKIVVDAPRNRLLVSNYFTGDLVQIDSNGEQSMFIQGADLIDGMELVGDTVFGVGTDRKIRAYNLVNGEPVFALTLPGLPANYLSSITYDSAGHLFISCPLMNEIYRLRLSDRSIWVFAREQGMNKPNGILLEREKGRIVVIDDSPGSTIHAISLADSAVSTLCSTDFASPDGIIRDSRGYYYVGGYYLPGMYRIAPDFSRIELFFEGESIVYPTYDRKSHSILIQHFDAGTWERVPIKDPGW